MSLRLRRFPGSRICDAALDAASRPGHDKKLVASLDGTSIALTRFSHNDPERDGAVASGSGTEGADAGMGTKTAMRDHPLTTCLARA